MPIMKRITLQPLAAITATGGGPDISLGGVSGFASLGVHFDNTAGTNPTLTAQLQGSSPASAGPSQVAVGANTDNGCYNGTNTPIAASIVPTVSQSVKSISLMIKQVGTITTGNLTLKIEPDSSGPSGTAVTNGTSATIAAASIGAAYSLVTFTFANPVDLTAGTTYWFVLSSSSSASSSNYIAWQSTTVASGGNQSLYYSAAWNAVTTQSFIYATSVYVFTAAVDNTGTALPAISGPTTATTLDASTNVYANYVGAVARLYYTIGGSASPSYYVAADLVATPINSNP